MPANGTFLPVLRPAPAPDAGWEVRVLPESQWAAHADGAPTSPLAVISTYVELTVSPTVSEVGAGSITLDRAAPVFTRTLPNGQHPSTLYTRDLLWCVYDEGRLVGEFLGQKVSRSQVDAGGTLRQLITISGAGPGHVLDRGVVMTPWYPKTTPKGKLGIYQFKNQPIMGSWLSLLREAQKRGTAGFVRPRFTTARDTARRVWDDTPDIPSPTSKDTTFAGDVLFNYDSSVLTTAGQAAVSAVVKKIAKVTYPRVIVVGHADSTGTRAYNQTLSVARAQAVADAIRTERPLAQIVVSGKGEDQPRASNATPAGRRKNRRVHVTYQSLPYPADTIYEPPRGMSLLDLLDETTGGQQEASYRGPIYAEWQMWPRFQLHVQPQLGRDRSGRVRFFDYSTTMKSRDVDRRYDEIRNLIAVRLVSGDSAGEYTVASSGFSRTRWGQREYYQELEGAYSRQARSQIARTILQAKAVEQESQTVQVSGNTAGRRPFRDYQVGDWIGLVRFNGAADSTVDRYRVIGMTVKVSGDAGSGGQGVTVELILSSVRQSRAVWLQRQIDALIAHRKGVRVTISDEEPRGGSTGDFWTRATEDV